MASQGRDRFFGSATAALIGAVSGREIIGVCRFASEEQALFERQRQVFPRRRMTRKRVTVDVVDLTERLLGIDAVIGDRRSA